MEKDKSSFYLLRLIILAGLISPVVFSACSSKKPVRVLSDDQQLAYFESFTYTGNDSYYKEHPLADSSSYYNPVLPGWYSDPSVCTNGKDYFLVTSTFSYYPGVDLFHSTDLMNWKQVGHILDRPGQLPLKGQKTSEGIFAPSISYNPHNQTYYLITTNIRKGNFFVTTKNPFGEWSDPIALPEVHGIDPSFFFDDDGQGYIINNDVPDGGSRYDGHRAIRIRKFNVATQKADYKSIMIVNGGVHPEEKPIWIEGPHLYKIQGKYYLMCAEGGTSVNHSEVIFRGDHPMGKFKAWKGNPILTQRDLPVNRPDAVTCSGHADLIQKANGQWWAVFLACRPNEKGFENLGRETFLMPVRWSKDGFPYLTRPGEEVPLTGEMDGVTRSAHPTFGNFRRSYHFNAGKPGNDWLGLRGPLDSLMSLTAVPGYLRLSCSTISSRDRETPAFLCRRLQHHQFEATSQMYFNPAKPGYYSGMLLYKDETHQYYLCVSQEKGAKTIGLKKITKQGIETVISKKMKGGNDVIDLKISSAGEYFSFYYARNDGSWNLLKDQVDAYYLSTANASGFTGTTIGLYATGKL